MLEPGRSVVAPTPVSERLPRLPGRDAAVSAIRDVLATARTAARAVAFAREARETRRA